MRYSDRASFLGGPTTLLLVLTLLVSLTLWMLHASSRGTLCLLILAAEVGRWFATCQSDSTANATALSVSKSCWTLHNHRYHRLLLAVVCGCSVILRSFLQRGWLVLEQHMCLRLMACSTVATGTNSFM